MNTNNQDRYQVVITEDYEGNTNDAFEQESQTFEDLEEARDVFESEKGVAPDNIGCYRVVTLVDLGETLNDYEELDRDVTEGDIIAEDAVIVNYKHVTYMNYAYKVIEVRKPNYNERYSDLYPCLDHTYATWSTVYDSIEDLQCHYENRINTPFDKLQSGSSIVEEFMAEQGVEEYQEETNEEE